MNNFKNKRCKKCGRYFYTNLATWTCPNCHQLNVDYAQAAGDGAKLIGNLIKLFSKK